jgi:anti-sigma-K factor RskA
MTCAEFRELAALHALGALSPEEAAAAEAHLREPDHEGCFEALSEASAGAEALARSLVPVKPDDRVWRGIQDALQPADRRGQARAMGLRERIAWFVAAAAVLLCAATLFGRQKLLEDKAALANNTLQAGNEKDECLRELSASKAQTDQLRTVVALLQSPSSKVFAFAPQPGQPVLAARAVVDLAQKKAMVLSASLPKQPGKDFQLWVIRGTTPQPAGLLRGDASGTVLAAIDPALLGSSFDALAVSVEPIGGSPTGKPTGSVVLVGALSKS